MTPAQFKQMYTQFSNVSDAAVQSKLDSFSFFFLNIDFSDASDTAQGLFAAHYLTIELSAGINAENIKNALTSGTFKRKVTTPEFSYEYGTPAFFEKEAIISDLKREKDIRYKYLTKVIDKYYEFFHVFINIPDIVGPYAETLKTTIYGQELIFLLYLVEKRLINSLQEQLQLEIEQKINNLNDEPIALIV
jgi:hypothetical protein